MRSRSSAIAAVMLDRGEADAMISGVVGRYSAKLKYVTDIIGTETGVQSMSALSAVACDRGTYFFTDTHVQYDPSAEQIAHSAIMAASRLKLFGIHRNGSQAGGRGRNARRCRLERKHSRAHLP
jgi:malate dehydrogenase (oxaloacetate-decarboxylating)(NADP+)